MSAVTRPRGPLPGRVYWTRRVLVLVAALALVFGIARLLHPGGADAGPAATPVAAARGGVATDGAAAAGPTPSGTPEPGSGQPGPGQPGPGGLGDQQGGSGGDDEKPERTKKKSKPARPKGPCADSDVLVAPVVEEAHAGGPVEVVLELRTVEAAACTWEVSPESVFVSIGAADRRLWASQHCSAAVPTEAVVPRRKKPARVKLVWNGRESDESCSTETPWVLPGEYTVTGIARGSVVPVETEFRLAEPVTPTITKAPTPTAAPRGGATEAGSSTGSSDRRRRSE